MASKSNFYFATSVSKDFFIKKRNDLYKKQEVAQEKAKEFMLGQIREGKLLSDSTMASLFEERGIVDEKTYLEYNELEREKARIHFFSKNVYEVDDKLTLIKHPHMEIYLKLEKFISTEELQPKTFNFDRVKVFDSYKSIYNYLIDCSVPNYSRLFQAIKAKKSDLLKRNLFIVSLSR